MASLALASGVILLAPSTAAADTEPGCDAESLQGVVGADTTVASAEMVEGDVSYCHVTGSVITTDPGPNTVNWMVALPENHNGRYYFIGLGGTAGYVPEPSPGLLAEGYAVAGTDTGNQTRQTGGLDWSILYDHAMSLDHDRRGGHVSAVATQAITRAYYGIDELYRYHSGCSGGGRMGSAAAINYPEDYDGIIVGTPGAGGVSNHLHFGVVAKHLFENPDGRIDTATLQAIGAQVLEDWDSADGAVDQMIWDPSVVAYTEDELDALLSGLTDVQRTTVELILEGYAFGDVNPLPGYPISSIQYWDLWMGTFVHQIADSLTRGAFGPEFNYLTDYDFFDRRQSQEFLRQLASRDWEVKRDNADYLNFRDAGGKLVMYSGVQDPVLSHAASVASYDDVVEASGGLAEAQSWARMFAVPGMSHCAGGTGPSDVPAQALDALVAWVEDGIAPDSIVATRTSDARTFLICAYPALPVFAGGLDNPQGLDVNDAANWQCPANPTPEPGGHNHGQDVSDAAHSCPPGPGHGECVREVAGRAPVRR